MINDHSESLESDELVIINDDSDSLAYTMKCPASTANLQFHSDGKTIGQLSWDTGVFVFEGEAEESAKIFFDFLSGPLENYLRERDNK